MIKIHKGENNYIGIEHISKYELMIIWLQPKELQQLHKKISKILGIVDWRVEIEKDKKKFICK